MIFATFSYNSEMASVIFCSPESAHLIKPNNTDVLVAFSANLPSNKEVLKEGGKFEELYKIDHFGNYFPVADLDDAY